MISNLRTVNAAKNRFFENNRDTIFVGDCMKLIKKVPNDTIDLVITSPPYCMGKDYESSTDVADFIEHHESLLPEIVRITRPGGSICWQVGYHVKETSIIPLDYTVYSILSKMADVRLRNRVIWTFGHGEHSKKRFSGRHETVLWFTKGEGYEFDLDSVRVPQKYPGKRHYKGPNKGEFSGNPLGKNPGDVWEIPNVKANHIEKTEHPCQFPVALVQRFIRALCLPGARIFDPFCGAGSTGVAATIEACRFLGAELTNSYAEIAVSRIKQTSLGAENYRPLEKPLHIPGQNDAVAQRPAHFNGG